MKRALLVVDCQLDFLPGGALAVPHGDQVVPVLAALANNSRYAHVVLTQDWHPKNHGSFASVAGKKPFELGELNGLPQVFWPDHCVQETPGSSFADGLLVSTGNVIRKGMDPKVDSYSGFFDNGKKKATGLNDLLLRQGITDLDVGGLATDYCVGWTVEDALQLGYKVRVIEDACRGIDPVASQAMLEKLAKLGAKIVGSGEI